MRLLWRLALVMILAATACGEGLVDSVDGTQTTTSSTFSETTSTVGVDEGVDDVSLESGYRCLGFESPAIDEATLAGIDDWEPAPLEFTSALSPESGRPLAELGRWVVWPQPTVERPEADDGLDEWIEAPLPVYVLAAALATEPLVLLASTGEPFFWPCEVAYTEYQPDFGYVAPNHDVGAASCELTSEEYGLTFLLYGVGASVPVRILVDGIEVQSGETEGSDDLSRFLVVALEEAGWPLEPFGVDPAGDPMLGASMVRMLPGTGAEGPVDVGAQLLGPDGWVEISCGSERMLTLDDVETVCAVDLADGVPRVVIEGAPLSVSLRRDGAELPPLLGAEYIDFAAPLGQAASYSLTVSMGDGSLTLDCGSVEVPAERDASVLLPLAERAAAPGGGPHAYWEYTLDCAGCDTSPRTVYFLITDGPPVDERLPDGHPGLLSPFTGHDVLLEAIAAGSDVSVEILDRGWLGSWEVDGVGVRTNCLVLDTLPPELGAAGPDYCNYDGD